MYGVGAIVGDADTLMGCAIGCEGFAGVKGVSV